MKELTTLFVYGTLRESAQNSGRYYIGPAYVAGELWDLGRFPGLIRPDLCTDMVLGDVYQVTAAELRDLDNYEGVSVRDGKQVGLYRREPITVTLTNGQTMDVEVYIFNQPLNEPYHTRIHSGDWLKHIETRSNGGAA